MAMFGIGGQGLISSQGIYYLIEYKYLFIIAIIASIPVYPAIQKRLDKMSDSWIKVLIIDYVKPFLL